MVAALRAERLGAQPLLQRSRPNKQIYQSWCEMTLQSVELIQKSVVQLMKRQL